MISETGMQQQFCLRWNNHKTNLLTVLGKQFRNEYFTDVTLACEDGSFIKCHKMVLAACSSYFQCLFSELQCKHPVVVLKDVRYSEIQAILEYIYKGEVSITQEEVEPLLKVAEALKVKGLVGENNYKGRSSEDEYNAISTSSAFGAPSQPQPQHHLQQQQQQQHHHHQRRRSSVNDQSMGTQRTGTPSPDDLSNSGGNGGGSGGGGVGIGGNGSSHGVAGGCGGDNSSTSSDSSRNDSNVAGAAVAVKMEATETLSPPHSTSIHPSFHQKSTPYPYGKGASTADNKSVNNPLSMPIWPMAGLPINTPSTPQTVATSMLNSCYEAVFAAAGNAEAMSPLRRKKQSNFYSNRDTPILRTVLGQGQADSSQPMSLVCHNNGQDQMPQSNGPSTPQDGSYSVEMSEIMHSPSSSPQSYYSDSKVSGEKIDKRVQSLMTRLEKIDLDVNRGKWRFRKSKVNFLGRRLKSGGVSSAIATYVPSQKPEWKRYKQYTRTDIMSAIDAVRHGMSALKASRKYGVPSRTLYDKVKKLGINTSRPMRQSNSNNGAAFPYGISGTGGSMMFGLAGDDEGVVQGAILEQQGLLQQALEIGGKIKLESSSIDREAMSSSTPPPRPSTALTPNSAVNAAAAAAAAAAATFSSQGLLQRALEIEERMKSTSTPVADMMSEREAMSLTHPGGNNVAVSGGVGGITPSSASPPAMPPTNDHRSPSPNHLIKYAQRSSHSLTPSPPHPPEDDEIDEPDNYEDQVEDLSMSRKPEQQSRVIMPPMNQATAAAMLATCSDNRRD